MDWLKTNAEVASFLLAFVVAAGGLFWWAIKRRAPQSDAPRIGSVSQKSGDRSVNVVSGSDANITVGAESERER